MAPADDTRAGSPDDEPAWAQRMAASANTAPQVKPPPQSASRELVATVGKHPDETLEEFTVRAIAEIAAGLKADFIKRQATT